MLKWQARQPDQRKQQPNFGWDLVILVGPLVQHGRDLVPLVGPLVQDRGQGVKSSNPENQQQEDQRVLMVVGGP